MNWHSTCSSYYTIKTPGRKSIMMRWLMRKSHNKKGFTPVQLMVVIAVIGVLATITVPQLNAYRMNSYKSACISDGKNAYAAAKNWFARNTCDI
jgi:hypothetical protein